MDSAQLDALAKLFEETTIPQWVRAYVIENADDINAALDRGETVKMYGPSGELIRVIGES
jgi:hypothetical protein